MHRLQIPLHWSLQKPLEVRIFHVVHDFEEGVVLALSIEHVNVIRRRPDSDDGRRGTGHG
jgi:hypothetical protein